MWLTCRGEGPAQKSNTNMQDSIVFTWKNKVECQHGTKELPCSRKPWAMSNFTLLCEMEFVLKC